MLNDRYIVTVGGTDASLMLWELTDEQQLAPAFVLTSQLSRPWSVVHDNSDYLDGDTDQDTDVESFEVLEVTAQINLVKYLTEIFYWSCFFETYNLNKNRNFGKSIS